MTLLSSCTLFPQTLTTSLAGRPGAAGSNLCAPPRLFVALAAAAMARSASASTQGGALKAPCRPATPVRRRSCRRFQRLGPEISLMCCAYHCWLWI